MSYDPLGLNTDGGGSTGYDPLGLGPSKAPEKPKEKGSSIVDTAVQFGKDTLGAAAGIGEMVGSAPGLVGSATAALMDAPAILTGKRGRATDVINNVFQSAGEGTLLPITKVAPSVAENPGYQAWQQTMQPGANIGKLVQAIGQNNNMPKVEAIGQGIEENFDPAFMATAGIAGARGGMAKPGSMEWYNQYHDATRKGAMLNADDAKFARSTYPTPLENQPLNDITTGGVGKRDTLRPDLPEQGQRGTEGWFNPSTTDSGYTGPVIRGEPHDNRIEYTKYNPEDVNALNEAESKPGFLQDSIDKINLRFDRQRQAEASNPAGQEKLALEDRASRRNRGLGELFTEDITEALPPIPVPARVRQKAEQRLAKNEHAAFTQMVPIEQVWAMRDHNRLTDPKSAGQWVEKEASVLKNGIFKPLHILYSLKDGKAVLTNGNTRASLAMKHGIDEVPVRVEVTKESLKDTEATNAVDVGHFNLDAGDAKPEHIGLDARDLGQTKAGSKERGGPKSDEIASRIKNRLASLPTTEESLKFRDRLNNLQTGHSGGALGPDSVAKVANEFDKWDRATNGGPGTKQRGGPGLFRVKPKDLTKVLPKLMDKATKSLADTVKDAGLSRDSLTDLDSTNHQDRLSNILAAIKKGGRSLFDARSIRAMFEGTPLEPIMTWLQQSIQKTDLDYKTRLRSDLMGSGYSRGTLDKVLGRGYEHHLGSPDGIMPALTRIEKMGEKISRYFIRQWDSMQGKEGEVPFENAKMSEAKAAIDKKAQERLRSINEKRAKLGKDPIHMEKNYFPRQREMGDYVLNAFDKATGKRYMWTFPTLKKAQLAAKQMKKDLGTMEIKDPAHKRLDRMDDTSLQALYETARAITGDDPLAKAVQQAIEKSTSQRGAGGHFRHRAEQVVGGYLGEKGNMKEFKRAWNMYMEFLNVYEANLDRALIQKEFDSLKLSGPEKPDNFVYKQNPKTGGWYKEDQTKESPIRDIAPVFHDYATQYLLQSRGALSAMDQFDKAVLEEIGKGLQLGEGALQRGIYKLNTIATVGFLSKVSFFVSQIFQHPMMTPPRMFKLLADVRTDMGPLAEVLRTPSDVGRIGASLARSYMYTFMPWLDASGSRTRLVNYAIKKGMVDPAASHMLEAPGSYGPLASTFYKVTGNLEREAVRIPSLIAIDDILRPYIKDENTRFEVATAQMFRAMAGTTKSNSPLVYSKLGPFGSLARTLKSYSTNWHGQMAEYMTQAIREGDVAHWKAFGAFLSTNALFAGILGVAAIPEVTAFINLYNGLTNSNVRTPQEWFMTNGNNSATQAAGGTNVGPDLTEFFQKYPEIKTIMTQGLASALLGKNITQQVAPPDLSALISIVPAKVPLTMLEPLIDYAVAVAQNQPTQVKAMHLWQGLSLNNPHVRAFLQKIYQQPDQPVPNPSMNMGGNYYRDYNGPQIDPNAVYNSQSQASAIAFGMLTTQEKTADTLYQFFKQNEMRMAKYRANTLNSMVDDLLSGKDLDESKMKDYIQKWGGGEALRQDINTTIMQRTLPGMTREMVKGHSGGGLSYAGKLVHQQQYLNQSYDPLGLKGQTPQPRADGGPVMPGQPYLVGERGPEVLQTPQGAQPVGEQGPEIIRPKVPGKVLPNINPAIVPNTMPGAPHPSLPGGVRAGLTIPMDSPTNPKMPGGMQEYQLDQELEYAYDLEKQANYLKLQRMQQQYPEQAQGLADIYRFLRRQDLDKEINGALQDNVRRRMLPKQM